MAGFQRRSNNPNRPGGGRRALHFRTNYRPGWFPNRRTGPDRGRDPASETGRRHVFASWSAGRANTCPVLPAHNSRSDCCRCPTTRSLHSAVDCVPAIIPREVKQMEFDLQQVRANVRTATTEDLLDRATVYRAGLEPDALPVILEELRSRGVTPDAIVRHEEGRQGVIVDSTGTARVCAECRKPAITHEWGWHRMFGKLPVFRRRFYRCEDHRTRKENDNDAT